MIPPRLQFFDANGKPLAGGLIYTYLTGTSTPATTYTDSTGTVVASNPIILDSGGFASIWLGALTYRIKVTDANNVQQYVIDGVTSANIQSVNSLTIAEATAVTGAAGTDVISGVSATHRLAMSLSAGTPDLIVGQNTLDSLSNKSLIAPSIANASISGNLSLSNIVSVYNGITTQRNGMPYEVAIVDQSTQQTAAVGSTALYTVPGGAAHKYLLAYLATIKQAASSSSTLGPINLAYTDADTGIVITQSSQTSAVNTTATAISGVLHCNVNPSTGISYSVGYTSSGGTPMGYVFHLTLVEL